MDKPDINKINETSTVFCNVCNKGYFDGFNLRHIHKTGECLKCDHISGEVMEQQVAEAKEIEDTFKNDLPF